MERVDQGQGTVANNQHDECYGDRAVKRRTAARWLLLARAATRNPGEEQAAEKDQLTVMSTDYDDREGDKDL